jgi:tRNA nucleotidyltransferase/poly(A) polymerase
MKGLLYDGAVEVARRLRDSGFESYFAGGCVRDAQLGVEPKDYDITTNATPEQIAKIFRRTVMVGAAFGVVRVLLDKREYEVATYRKDSTYSDGRHPDAIAYAKTKEEDVARRDFTINALLFDPFTSHVVDVVGGLEDLGRGVIRAVGDPFERFREDRLRMLRAIRFAARFGFAIEGHTFNAIRREAAEISAVSMERIVTEMDGIFSAKDPAHGYDLLVASGLWAYLPTFQAPNPRERLARLPLVSKEHRPLIAWAILSEGTADREDRLRELKMSRVALRTVEALVRAKPLLETPASHALHERVRLMQDPDAELMLAYAEVLGLETTLLRELHAQLVASPLANPVNGADLKALGIAPGPHYKELLGKVEIEVFENRIHTREEALAYLEKLVRQ